jgi:hypothetical protein
MKYLKFVAYVLGVTASVLALIVFLSSFSSAVDYWTDFYYASDEAYWITLIPAFQFLFGVIAPAYFFFHFWKKMPGALADIINSRRSMPDKQA